MSRFYRKIGSWLGLFAILMATLAPTISHTLAARNEAGAILGAYCGMPPLAAVQADAAALTSGAPGQSLGKSAQHSATSDSDACGYCSLLAHMPVMPSVEGLFVVAVRTLQHTVATRFESVRRAEPLTFAQPRAPPFPS
ncbi:DUF2946 domain-containing protein [Paraburkholderia ginsengiterrae]|uniref:DUF2946 domain-containing protein n=1 Tax=Paraburkholderia ginsengiterrae TaxID=1462993 RepID=UPI000B1D5A94